MPLPEKVITQDGNQNLSHIEGVRTMPSDQKQVFQKLKKHCSSLKMSSFGGDVEVAKSIHNYEKQLSECSVIVIAILSCRSVAPVAQWDNATGMSGRPVMCFLPRALVARKRLEPLSLFNVLSMLQSLCQVAGRVLGSEAV